MKRKIEQKLLEWKNRSNGSTAMLISGARRTGKSYIVKKFAEDNYDSYILVDFNEASEGVKSLFENYLHDLDTFFMYLQNEYKVKLTERKSLIIFDEVQLFPRARAAIKFLVADGRFDYIETGSLISINENVKDILIPSEEENLDMFPMDFEEFLWAMGNDILYGVIEDCFKKNKPMGPLHRMAMDYFKQYMIVGGMPQAVAKYVETKDFAAADKVKRDILKLYKDDVKKYSKGDKLKVGAIFENIPSQLQHHWKKFTVSELGQAARMREYADAFYWLADSYIVNLAMNTTEPNIGFNQNADDNSLKCYMGDTGILLAMTFDERELGSSDIYKKILGGKLAFNEGMFFENIVAQMMRAAGNKLYFYTNNTSGADRMEIDFLARKAGVTSKHNVLPIEVKSGDRYTFNSLKKYLSKFADYTGTAYIIHAEDLKTEIRDFGPNDTGTKQIRHELRYLPVYMAGLL